MKGNKGTSEKKLLTDPVKTESGLVSGIYNSDQSIRIFAGIPYAAPPVGELRWKAPQPIVPWNGVRLVDHFGNCAMQPRFSAILKFFIKLFIKLPLIDAMSFKEELSEDCLFLNIWTPAKTKDERKPVIVFIHGGGFFGGSGSTGAYNGEAIAKKGVVYVTINYRLGIFGFYAHPELTRESGYHASGNYGILDQVCALKWIKTNIAEFGGDPDNVTIAGESAGAISVNILTASPLASGLFQRAIAESGAIFDPVGKREISIFGLSVSSFEQGEQAGLELARILKKSSVSDLRKMSASDLQKKSSKSGKLFMPILDRYLLSENIYDIFAQGKQNDVPVLIGSNKDEGSILLLVAKSKPSAFKEQIRQEFKDEADAVFKLYPAETDREIKKSRVDYVTDNLVAKHMYRWAILQGRTGKSKVYSYYFDRTPPGSKYGSYHSAEIAYAYSNLSKLDKFHHYEDIDRKLSELMSSYWVNFAATGNPNGNGLPEWPAFDEKTNLVMELGDNVHPIPIPHKAALDFFETHDTRRVK